MTPSIGPRNDARRTSVSPETDDQLTQNDRDERHTITLRQNLPSGVPGIAFDSRSNREMVDFVPTANSHVQRLRAHLCDWQAQAIGPPVPQRLGPIEHLVHAFLNWEASSSQATTALTQLLDYACDFNDLRVCRENEVAEVIGPDYPQSRQRSRRLLACLNSLYECENDVAFCDPHGLTQRQLRKYLNSLDGMVPFVLARLQLLHFRFLAMPMDTRLLASLRRHDLLPPELTLRKAQTVIERLCETVDHAQAVYFAIESWAAQPGE